MPVNQMTDTQREYRGWMFHFIICVGQGHDTKQSQVPCKQNQ